MIKNKKVQNCKICGSDTLVLKYTYNAPPTGETIFSFSGDNYYREYWECVECFHLNTSVDLDLAKLYSGEYGSSTYKDIDGIHKTFQKVMNFPKEKSDNKGRVDFVDSIVGLYLASAPSEMKVLDVGSGLGVFPYEMSLRGYHCVASDPDIKSCEHISSMLKLSCHHGEFQTLKASFKFDLVTFNKVLEHVEWPIELLRLAKNFVRSGGIIYVELPDADGAANSLEGQEREEFFIEHLHVFTMHSTLLLGKNAGLSPLLLQRIQEPSSKYTIRSLWRF